MNNPTFFSGGYYHIYNRGVEKRNVFTDTGDYSRFLETMDFYRKIPSPMKLSDFRRGTVKLKEIKTQPQTELVKILCYCLMPNHFHFLIQAKTETGISTFMRKTTNSYTRYFNTRHKRVGSLFQGVFKAKLIETNEYLLQLSKYIHRNPFPLDVWEGKSYPYSSYRNYLSGQQHAFCDIGFILSYFSDSNPTLSYKSFVEEADLENPNVFKYTIDHEDH